MAHKPTYAELEKRLEQLEAERGRYAESEQQAFFSMSLYMLCIADIQTATFIKVNPAFTRTLGFSEEELLGRPYVDFVHPDDVAATRRVIEESLMKGRKVINFKNRYQCKDGSYRWLNWVSHPLPEKGLTYAVAHDITDEIRAGEALRQSEARFRAYFHNAPVGMAVIDTERKFLEVNRQICRILGYSPDEMIGRSFNAFTHPDDRDGGRRRWQEMLEGKTAFNQGEKRYVNKNGQTVWSLVTNSVVRDDNGTPLYFLSYLVDTSAQKKAQEEARRLEILLQQSQKFEALGTLAGGTAHDFNNLLMGIQGRASLLMYDLGETHPCLGHAEAILEYTRSAADLTRQLLGLAQGGKYEVRPFDINELVAESAAMFGRTKKEIRIHTTLAEPAPVVMGDRNQIEQVLLNLYINAWQAMPSGGELYLQTSSETLDEAYCRPYAALPGRYAKISVTDTGRGMNAAVRNRVFDPFFTTKEKGRGTGLGLASAYGIVKNHKGIITVYSEVGQGATFNIYLPLSDQKAYREKPMEKAIVKGTETILLVDDEKIILEVGKEMLSRLGYAVVLSEGGREALAVINDPQAVVDLVILDMIMPEMDGGKVFDAIREMRPDLPVLLSSGYSINGQAAEILERGCNGFIQKPFNLQELSQKVRKIIDRAPVRGGGRPSAPTGFR